MKKFLLALGFFSATSASAQSTDVSTLSEYDQQMHRAGFCWQLASWNINSLNFQFDIARIYDVHNLLVSNGFILYTGVFTKSASDLEAKLILDELELTQTMFDECNQDMKAMLKQEYVPNFSYMTE